MISKLERKQNLDLWNEILVALNKKPKKTNFTKYFKNFTWYFFNNHFLFLVLFYNIKGIHIPTVI